jgi:hypothetical protein
MEVVSMLPRLKTLLIHAWQWENLAATLKLLAEQPCPTLRRLGFVQSVGAEPELEPEDFAAWGMLLRNAGDITHLLVDARFWRTAPDAGCWLDGLATCRMIQHLNLDLSGTLLSDTSVLHGFKNLTCLQTCHLTMYRCDELRDVACLADGLSKTSELKELTLDFGACEGLAAVGVLGRPLRTLASLRKLKLDFYRCEALPDDELKRLLAGVAELASVEHLTLWFSECRGVTDVTPVADAVAALATRTLRHCTVNVNREHWGYLHGNGIRAYDDSAFRARLELLPLEEFYYLTDQGPHSFMLY